MVWYFAQVEAGNMSELYNHAHKTKVVAVVYGQKMHRCIGWKGLVRVNQRVYNSNELPQLDGLALNAFRFHSRKQMCLSTDLCKKLHPICCSKIRRLHQIFLAFKIFSSGM